jgi:transcriptional regulator with XRE-family HTH domain
MVTEALARWGRTRGPITPVWELEALRRARALSVSELSVRANLNITTVYRVLHGLSSATPRTKRRLASALRVEPDMIMWPEQPRTNAEAQ